MEELQELKKRLEEQRPVDWETFPDLALYMDQVLAYMPRQLIHYGEGEVLTSAMVNNYIKDGLMPRADGKRYSRRHLAYLTAICVLKQVLSVKETARLISAGSELHNSPEALYGHFCRKLDAALAETAGDLPEDAGVDDLPQLALDLALRSYADRLACQRVLDILAQRTPAPEKPAKKRDRS